MQCTSLQKIFDQGSDNYVNSHCFHLITYGYSKYSWHYNNELKKKKKTFNCCLRSPFNISLWVGYRWYNNLRTSIVDRERKKSKNERVWLLIFVLIICIFPFNLLEHSKKRGLFGTTPKFVYQIGEKIDKGLSAKV